MHRCVCEIECRIRLRRMTLRSTKTSLHTYQAPPPFNTDFQCTLKHYTRAARPSWNKMTDSAQFTEPLLFAYYTFEFESVALHVYRWFAIDASTAFLFSSANVRKFLTCLDFGTNGPIEPSVPSFHVSHNSRRVIDAWFCPSPSPHYDIPSFYQNHMCSCFPLHFVS